MVSGCSAGRFRDFSSLPAAGAHRYRRAPCQFFLGAFVRVGDLRRAWPGDGSDRGSVPGQMAGPADPGILSCDLQYAGVLAGDPAAFDLRRMAGLAAGGTFSAGGDGRRGGYCRGPAPACHTPCPDIEHYRRGEYRAPHKREDDRRHGIGLCTLRPGAGRIGTLRHPAPWSAQCGSSGDHTAVCVCQ